MLGSSSLARLADFLDGAFSAAGLPPLLPLDHAECRSLASASKRSGAGRVVSWIRPHPKNGGEGRGRGFAGVDFGGKIPLTWCFLGVFLVGKSVEIVFIGFPGGKFC